MLTARLRALLRLRTEWVASGALVPGTPECDAFSDGLLLVPEHTWGKDLKTYLPDYVNYEKAAFQRARAADVIDPAANPDGVRRVRLGLHRAPQPAGPVVLGVRSLVGRAARPPRPRARRAVARAPRRSTGCDRRHAPRRDGADDRRRQRSRSTSPRRTTLGAYRVRFGDDGALVGLVDAEGVEWADPEHPLAAYRYQTFDERDEARWLREYCRNLDENALLGGARSVQARPRDRRDPARDGLRAARGRRPTDSTTTRTRSVVLELALPEQACRGVGRRRATSGSPTGSRRSRGRSRSPSISAARTRRACPRPAGSGSARAPRRASGDSSKLGTPVDPQSVVRNGNRSLHAVAEVTHTAARPFSLRPLDAALVAVGPPALLRFDNAVPDPDDGFHVNLHNNVWGTNFTMWFDDDLRFRFLLELA